MVVEAYFEGVGAPTVSMLYFVLCGSVPELIPLVVSNLVPKSQVTLWRCYLLGTRKGVERIDQLAIIPVIPSDDFLYQMHVATSSPQLVSAANITKKLPAPMRTLPAKLQSILARPRPHYPLPPARTSNRE